MIFAEAVCFGSFWRATDFVSRLPPCFCVPSPSPPAKDQAFHLVKDQSDLDAPEGGGSSCSGFEGNFASCIRRPYNRVRAARHCLWVRIFWDSLLPLRAKRESFVCVLGGFVSHVLSLFLYIFHLFFVAGLRRSGSLSLFPCFTFTFIFFFSILHFSFMLFMTSCLPIGYLRPKTALFCQCVCCWCQSGTWVSFASFFRVNNQVKIFLSGA